MSRDIIKGHLLSAIDTLMSARAAAGHQDMLTLAIEDIKSAVALLDWPAVAMTNPASQSSVQIESRAKGAPTITVKVYDADPFEAAKRATTLYDGLLESYTAEAKEATTP